MANSERTCRAPEKLRSPRWELASVEIRNGLPIYISLTPEQQRRTTDYQQALRIADKSDVANPIFSGFHVGEAIGPIGGEKRVIKLPSGNIEYGYLNALHAEECSYVLLAVHFPGYKGDVVLAIIAAGVPAPCGNCRDLMLDNLNNQPERLEIVTGEWEGGVATVINFKNFLFEDYEPFSPGENLNRALDVEIDLIRKNARRIEYDPYSPVKNPHPERKYSAGIKTIDDLYTGAFYGYADYHPGYPLTNAIIKAENDVFMDNIVIVSTNEKDNPPHVMYLDRQHLYERNQIQESILNREIDPPVFLVNENRAGRKIWRTSVKQLLPMPFSSDRFGPDFKAQFDAYNKNFINRSR